MASDWAWGRGENYGGYGGGGSSIEELLERLQRSYGQQSSEPRSFRDLPREERQPANRLALLQLAQAIGSAEPGRLGEGLARGATGFELTRQQAVEDARRRAAAEREDERRSLEGQVRLTQAQQALRDEAATQARLREALATPPEGSGIDPRLWNELPPGERMKVHADTREQHGRQEQQRVIADRVAKAVEASGGNPEIARELVLAGATPGQALEAAMPKEEERQLTPYQQAMLGRSQADDAVDAQERAERQAERERETEAIGEALRAAGQEPSGVLAVDRMRYQRLLQDPAAAAGAAPPERPPLRVTAPPRFSPDAVLPTDGAAPRGPAAPRIVGPGVAAVGAKPTTASVYRGGPPATATTSNTVAPRREKAAEEIIRGAGLPQEAVNDPDLRSWVLAELAKPGADAATILATLRARLNGG